MEIALLLADKILQLTLMVLLGYLIVKTKLLKSEHSYPISVIGLYIISPAMLITAFQVDYTTEILNGLYLAFLISVLLNGLLILLGWLLKRALKLDNIEQATAIYSNSGNLIIPIVASLFGNEWVIYSTAFIVVQNVLFWSHLRLLICGKGNVPFRKMIFNINIIAIVIGMMLFLLHIKLPATLANTLSTLGHMLGPLAMLVAGMLIAAIPFKEIITDKRIYLVAFLRLIFIPLILLAVIKLGGFASWIENGKTVVMITFLATISPSAATATQMAVAYGQDAKKASAIYGVTTLLCVFTMPLIIWLYQFL
ncbi:TPA: AEC family transporter [Mannheimia haemolytica]|uniref:AEC family transporter n=1 Tax=Mannheimia haemolytica TaxID=75985 RepID=A0A248ZZJ9_MANHA|nr:AEC family transporter [Mannheimia haemolytica]AWW70946.1 autotransporter [Pasteurellaceae bacterium 12565]AGI32044.1 autotransporter [Mannheimia haemolytica USDA-ARS-USMARC-183]AGK03127.1 AEC family putative malonate efflux carrier [Mannheimia haemolytica M42548]AGQ25208.1 autotransporter [Mannheimia haemolytica D153]AGQ40765.1 autotransporter [Mannheimia haemolytica D174]